MRPAELAAIRAGDVDVAFRRWERPRVKVGTRMRTAVGLVEVTSVDRVPVRSLTAADARRAGAASLAALRQGLDRLHPDRPVYRIGLRYAGVDPRHALREAVPDAAEIDAIVAWLDRLDRASPTGHRVPALGARRRRSGPRGSSPVGPGPVGIGAGHPAATHRRCRDTCAQRARRGPARTGGQAQCGRGTGTTRSRALRPSTPASGDGRGRAGFPRRSWPIAAGQRHARDVLTTVRKPHHG
jgi:hypothetical protein